MAYAQVLVESIIYAAAVREPSRAGGFTVGSLPGGSDGTQRAWRVGAGAHTYSHGTGLSLSHYPHGSLKSRKKH